MRLKGYSGLNFKNIKGYKINIFRKRHRNSLTGYNKRYFEISSIQGGVTDDIKLNDENLIVTLSLLL